MRARYMDPVLGRFISEDPSRDGVNCFVYCADEPINQVDNNKQAALTIFEGFWSAFCYLLGLCIGYMLTTELIEATHPGYHGGYAVFISQTGIAALGGMIPMLFVGSKADRARATEENIGAFMSELIERFNKCCPIATLGLITRVALLRGVIVGAVCAIIEFYNSDYCQESTNNV
ncbi:RHS repeat-associated core domain [Chthonomonas calidirosea]|nr:RHS repeat-associated core domain [Chthonomonas calidirosea]